jgi:hypothetical protein
VDGVTLSEKRRYAGRLGGIQKAINTASDPAASTARARAAFLATFGTRHVCSLGCDVTIPEGISAAAREKAARLAQTAHFARMAHQRDRDR